MADNVRVGVRLRPFNARELAAAEPPGQHDSSHQRNHNSSAPHHNHNRLHLPAWTADACTGVVAATDAISHHALFNNNNKFAFDHVFDHSSTNEDVYTDLAKPVVDSALAGYNGTVFAYGQTSSGKTHSMLGRIPEDPGVTPRAVADIMRVAQEAAGGRQYLIRVSYCEIYNEIIRDLLDEETKELKVREDGQGRTFIDAQEVVVKSVNDAMKVLEQGQKLRAVGETAMNQTSSRSHTIFTLIIESRGVAVGSEKSVRSSMLYLVDLAGSERAKSTQAEGQRLREGAHINKSLLTLGTIINKLSSGQDAGHLPYRDSKLTRVLRQALGGNARTAILCAATPSPVHAEETLSTLKFAERAKKIKNSAIRNEITDYKAKFNEAHAELLVLRSRLAAYENGTACSVETAGGLSGVTGPDADTATPARKPTANGTAQEVAGISDDRLDMGSIRDQVALTVELQRAKEEIAFLRERAESAELENVHLKESLKKKYKELRSIRSRTTEMCTAARHIRGREKALQHSVVQSYFQLESARQNLQQSKKKGSHVLMAENVLYEISMKMAMFVPDQEFTSRGLGVEERSPPTNRVVSPSSSVPNIRPDDNIPSLSPLTPHSGPIDLAATYPLSRAPVRSFNGHRRMDAGRIFGEENGTESAPSDEQSNGNGNGRAVVEPRRASVQDESAEDDMVLDKSLAELTSDTSSQDDDASCLDGSHLSSAKTEFIKRKNNARDSIREFYGGSSAIEDQLAGGHQVMR